MLTANDFCKHKFDSLGEAAIAVVNERVLIGITDAAILIHKERKHLIKWILNNRVTIFHAAKSNETRSSPDGIFRPEDFADYITAIFFDDFIDFCIHERDVADNQNASIFITHLLETEIIA